VAERKSDRRVAYTKLALKGALVDLMRSKSISQITITSNCELADINRSTFYTNYRDQYDLLHQTRDEVLCDIENILALSQNGTGAAETPVTFDIMVAILEYTKDNIGIAQTLLGTNCDFSFKQDILDLAKKVVPFPESPLDQRTIDIIMTHAINGCFDLIDRWLDEGAVESPREVAVLMLQLVYSGTTSFVS
jgi:AcrR family transcriptional regulator